MRNNLDGIYIDNNSLLLEAKIHLGRGETEKASKVLKKLEYRKMYKKDSVEKMEYNGIYGQYYHRLGELETAAKYYKKAVAFAEEKKKYSELKEYYSKLIGIMFALEHLEESDILKENLDRVQEELDRINGFALLSKVRPSDALKEASARYYVMSESRNPDTDELTGLKNVHYLKRYFTENIRNRMAEEFTDAEGTSGILSVRLNAMNKTWKRLDREDAEKWCVSLLN